MHKEERPYGSWPSPISAQTVASSGSGSSSLPREVQTDKTGVYWIELRPAEGGRYVIQRLDPSGAISTITPEGFSVRTKVHEYGGGAYLLWNGSIFFSNEADQRIYRHDPGNSPRPITPAPSKNIQYRFANGCISKNGAYLFYVCEKHSGSGTIDNYLVKLPSDGTEDPQLIHHGHDFYACPRLSPDGTQFIWLTWDHPNMPWDGTDLWLADFDGDRLDNIEHIAGGQSESIFQPEWDDKGAMYFVSDRTGWWNIYQRHEGEDQPMTNLDLEFGQPLWSLGYKVYTVLEDGRIVAIYKDKGLPGIAIINLRDQSIKQLEIDYTYIEPTLSVGFDQSAWFLAGSPFSFPGLTRLNLANLSIERVKEVHQYDLDEEFISVPDQIQFDSPNGGFAYAYHYPAHHPTYTGLGGEAPPLIVMGHGGPTSAARPYLNPEIQFWTSRGFSVVDVDYSGSTGYGRAYRERLCGTWGEADVADCVEAARYLAKTGRADPDRLIITGGSAGGYIVLRALTEYSLFSVGASYYGVADILALGQDTVKFESKYEHSLIGPYPEFADLYHQRSPINHADKISCPVILFQGMEDKIVPPSQSEIFIEALQEKGIHHQYVTYKGEGHGFRRKESIQSALEHELAFYRDVLKIPFE